MSAVLFNLPQFTASYEELIRKIKAIQANITEITAGLEDIVESEATAAAEVLTDHQAELTAITAHLTSFESEYVRLKAIKDALLD